MKHIIKKADILIESLSYIKEFKGDVFVIKIGGENIEDKAVFDNLLNNIAFLSFVGIKVILIHGGGKFISRKMKLSGIKPKFVDGLRITCKDTILIAEDALYRLNQIIVEKLKKLGVHVVGLNPREVTVISAKKKQSQIDFGFVGDVKSINRKKLNSLLKKDSVIVISPLGQGSDLFCYNINADMVASKIATALNARKLIFMTNVDGILSKKGKHNLLSTLTEKKAYGLIKDSNITGGMIPKVESALNALENGVNKVHIINAKLKHALLFEIFTDKGIGTQIIK